MTVTVVDDWGTPQETLDIDPAELTDFADQLPEGWEVIAQ